jgi:hypothetical protein
MNIRPRPGNWCCLTTAPSPNSGPFRKRVFLAAGMFVPVPDDARPWPSQGTAEPMSRRNAITAAVEAHNRAHKPPLPRSAGPSAAHCHVRQRRYLPAEPRPAVFPVRPLSPFCASSSPQVLSRRRRRGMASTPTATVSICRWGPTHDRPTGEGLRPRPRRSPGPRGFLHLHPRRTRIVRWSVPCGVWPA